MAIEKRLKTKYRDLKVTFTVAEGISEEEGWQNLKRAYDILFKHVEEENKKSSLTSSERSHNDSANTQAPQQHSEE